MALINRHQRKLRRKINSPFGLITISTADRILASITTSRTTRTVSTLLQLPGLGRQCSGFGTNIGSRYQQYNPSHTWTISNSLINEFRFTYMREGQLTFQHPQTTATVQNSCTTPAAQAVCFNGTSDSSAINSIISGAGIPTAQAGITTGLPVQSHRSSLHRYCGRILNWQRVGRRTAAGR